MEISTRRGVFVNTDCLKCLEVTRIDSYVSYNQPSGLGRTQGWGLWADTPQVKKITSKILGNICLSYDTFRACIN